MANFEATQGDDTFSGTEPGTDTVSYAAASAGVTVNLRLTGPQSTGGSSNDTFVFIDNLVGSAFNDILFSNGRNGSLDGGLGDDRIGAVLVAIGSTTLAGGDGIDTLVIDASVLNNARFSGGLSVGEIYDSQFGALISLSGFERLEFTGNATGTAYSDGISGGAGNDVLTGLSGADNFTGGGGNDTINGADGDDRLNGGRGNNTLDGGAGTDTATLDFSDRTGDLVIVNGGVQGTVYTATVAGVAAGSIRNIELFNVIGGSGNDRIGGAINVVGETNLSGGDGFDTLVVDASVLNNARFSGGTQVGELYDSQFGTRLTLSTFERLEFTGNATGTSYVGGVSGGAGDDILTGLLGADVFTGGGGDDIITGADGDDTLDGGRGNNTIDGGAGTDTAALDFSDRTGDLVIVNGGVQGTVYTATVAGVAAGSIRNIELFNVTGGSGNDRIGGAINVVGVTTLAGGDGFDTLVVDASVLNNARFSGGLGVGELHDNQFGTRLTLSSFERLEFTGNATGTSYAGGVSGGAGDDILTGLLGADVFSGGGGNDTINGADGDDRLDGGRGNNTLDGGAGTDTATLDFSDRTANLVIVNGAVGGVTYAASVAGVAAGSIRNIELFNVIGGSGNDRIGGAINVVGVTTLAGGDGFDTLVVDASVLNNARFSGGLGVGELHDNQFGTRLTLSSFERLEFTGNATGTSYAGGVSGGAGDDILTGLLGADVFSGGGGNDTINGADGDDRLDGGRGNNTLDGGAGTDTATLDFSDRTGDLVIVNGGVQGTVYTATVAGVAAGSIRNIELFNVTGGSGNDRIGGAINVVGETNLSGGDGFDTLVVDASVLNNARFSGGTQVGELYDSQFGTHLILSGFERLEFTGNSNGITGGAGDDILTGLLGADIFTGGGGGDRLVGGGGNDMLDGGDGVDVAVFSGQRSSYIITRNEATGVITVTDTRGVDGQDTLVGIEFLEFADQAYTPIPNGGANAAPVRAGGQTVLGAGFEDTAYTVTTLQLTRGFADPDNDALTVQSISADHGTVSNAGNGNFTLTPEPDYAGPVTFSYVLSDGHGGTIAATLNLVLQSANDAPVLVGTPASLPNGDEGVPYFVSLAALTQGYVDLEGDSFAVANVAVDHGAVQFDAEAGGYVITPQAAFNGVIHLSYQLVDSQGAGRPISRSISFADDKLAPVQTGAAAVLDGGIEDTPYIVSAADLLTGFSDPEGDPLAVVNLTANHGTVANNGDGTFTVTPSANYAGLVTLNYQVFDGELSLNASNHFTLIGESVAQVAAPTALAAGEVGQARISYIENVLSNQPGLVLVTARGALVADPFSGVFGQSALLLTGIDNPADSLDIIDIAVQMAATPSAASLSVVALDRDTAIDWQAMDAALRPDGTSDAAWVRISPILQAELGPTYGTLASALGESAARMASFGMGTASASTALLFEVGQAADFGTFEAREAVGSLGEGWAFIGDTRLQVAGGGDSVVLRGLPELSAFARPDIDALAAYTLSASVGRGVLVNGVLSGAPTGAVTFARQADGRYASSDGALTLTATATGYEIATNGGETLVFNASGRLLNYADGLGRQTTASYNGDGRMNGLSGPDNRSLTFHRDGAGRVDSITDGFGAVRTFTYDADGRLATSASAADETNFDYLANGDLSRVAGAGLPVVEIGYDAQGRLGEITVAGGGQTEDYGYDGTGGFTVTDANGHAVTYALLPNGQIGRVTDASGRSVSLTFDEEGNLVGSRGSGGISTEFVLDEQGRILSVADGTAAEVKFAYSGDSLLPTSFTDANGHARDFTYNAAGQVTQAVWHDGTSLSFTYDADGNALESVGRDGTVTTYSYNAAGNIVSASRTSAGAASFSYDAGGRLIDIVNSQGTTSLDYDTAGRVTGIEFPDGKSLTYTYDTAGRRTSMTDQDGHQTLYTYDTAGRLASVENESGDGVAYQYNTAGYLLKEINGNGTTTDYAYDTAGKVTDIVNRAPGGAISSEFHYNYDAAGRRSAVSTSDGDWTYGYDTAGQLTSALFASTNPAIPDKVLVYVYDPAGNRTSVTEDGVTTLYTTNALNQYTAVGDDTFTYDDNGNMTSRTTASGMTAFAYDALNRLTQVTTATGTVTTYEYDAFGNRSAETTDGIRTAYLVDPFGLGNVVAEYTDASLTSTYLHGLNLVARVGADATATFFDLDAVASVVGVTGTDGNLANTYAYGPFGSVLSEAETLFNRFEFNGGLGVTEDGADLTFMRARQYDTSLGRFTTEDPLWYSSDVENLYRFALNDPSSYVDPLGLEQWNTVYSPTAPPSHPITREEQVALDVILLLASVTMLGRAVWVSRAVYNGVFAASGGLAEALAWGKVVKNLVDKPKNIYNIADKFKDIREGNNPDPGEEDEDSQDIEQEEQEGGESRGVTFGDPHLVTFDGLGYDFQAVGEFTLIRGADFEIQVRQKAAGTSVSLNSAVAMRLGADTVALYAGAAQPLLINGQAYALTVGQAVAIGGGVVFRSASDTYSVVDADGNGFSARYRGQFMNVSAFIGEGQNGLISGLLGDADGDGTNDLVLADGTVLAGTVAAQVLYGAFADTWRVSNATSLFTYGPGEDTETYTDRDFPGEVITLADLPPEVRAAAEAIALAAGLVPGTLAFDNAVLDVALTGDPSFAELAADAPPPATEPTPLVIQRPPVANDDVASTAEDVAIEIDVLNNDSDPEDDALQVTQASDSAGGSVTILPDGRLSFTPRADFFGQTVISYTLSDGAGNNAVGHVTVTIAGVNDAPVLAILQTALPIAQAGQAYLLRSADLLAGFADVDGDILALANLTADSGSLIDNHDGTWTFTPAPGSTGTVTFGYDVVDGHGGVLAATRQLPVVPAATAANDVVSGGTGNDVYDGGGGNDVLHGLSGDDILSGGLLSDQIFGDEGDDTLDGGQGGDLLHGGAGADTLGGGDDGDKLYGEDGDDTLDGDDGNDLLFGESGVDTLSGGDGNDTLDGGGQRDTLAGGAGNDVYIVENVGVIVNEAADQGYDIVRASLSYVLGDNLEALQLQGVADINGTGNGLANNIQGNAGANRLDGGAGVDTLNGNDGDDIIVGGLGNDLLRGGSGADVFRVAHVATGTLETDQIYDFSTAEGDTLDLSGAFAGVLNKVDVFTKVAGQLTLTFASGITTVRLDTTGDGKVDYQVKINGDVTGDWTGWTL